MSISIDFVSLTIDTLRHIRDTYSYGYGVDRVVVHYCDYGITATVYNGDKKISQMVSKHEVWGCDDPRELLVGFVERMIKRILDK